MTLMTYLQLWYVYWWGYSNFVQLFCDLIAGAFSVKLNVFIVSILLILLSGILLDVDVADVLFVELSPLAKLNLLKSIPYACNRSVSPILSEAFGLSEFLCNGCWKYGYKGLLRPSLISGRCNDWLICFVLDTSEDFDKRGSKSSLLFVESKRIKSGTSGESYKKKHIDIILFDRLNASYFQQSW